MIGSEEPLWTVRAGDGAEPESPSRTARQVLPNYTLQLARPSVAALPRDLAAERGLVSRSLSNGERQAKHHARTDSEEAKRLSNQQTTKRNVCSIGAGGRGRIGFAKLPLLESGRRVGWFAWCPGQKSGGGSFPSNEASSYGLYEGFLRMARVVEDPEAEQALTYMGSVP